MADERAIEQERFAELSRTGDPALRNQLVEDYLWLARHCARRFAGRGESPDDLNPVAMMALVRAVDRFAPSFKVRFARSHEPRVGQACVIPVLFMWCQFSSKKNT